MEGMQEGRVQGEREEDENMQCINECGDAGSHHAAFKKDALTIRAIVKRVVQHFWKYHCSLPSLNMKLPAEVC